MGHDENEDARIAREILELGQSQSLDPEERRRLWLAILAHMLARRTIAEVSPDLLRDLR